MRRLLFVIVMLAVAASGGGASAASGTAAPPSTAPAPGYDLERPPSECIGLLPRPDCGREPTQAGDRGGALQYAVFGVMLAGLALIFTVVFRNVLRADRAKTAAAARATGGNDSAGEQVSTER